MKKIVLLAGILMVCFCGMCCANGSQTDDVKVYVTKAGKCYHSKYSCPGSKNVYVVTLTKARARHLKPCQKCYY